MREITTHHDGHGLNERVRVLAVDEPGPGGASHRYEFHRTLSNIEADDAAAAIERAPVVGFLQFQRGARNEPGSTPGMTTAAVLAALIDHLGAFQSGPYPSRETALVITKLEEALHWLRARADERAARGVLGQNEQ